MGKRLDVERQKQLEPERAEYAMNKLAALGYEVTLLANGKEIRFLHKGKQVIFFPFSGWHSGKTITDGRGIKNLLKQLKE